MGTDRHLGRSSPTYPTYGRPEAHLGILTRHGVFARIKRARRCPCGVKTGAPSMYCKICHGDGFIYDFQRKLQITEEDADVKADRSIVNLFRVPVLEVIDIHRLLPPEQGGIKKYKIEWFSSDGTVKISGDPLPHHYEKMWCNYYFDRFKHVIDEEIEVDSNTKTLLTHKTKEDDGYVTSNPFEAHGDIVIVERLYNTRLKHEYKDFTFIKNFIQLGDSEPTPQPGEVLATYYYCPVARILPGDINSRDEKEDSFTNFPSGSLRMAMDYWFEVSKGDLITLLSPQFYRDEIIAHNSIGIDKLTEFDISTIEDEIFDEDGNSYRKRVDYVLRGLRDIVWFGRQPKPGKSFSVRYSYFPTYVIFDSNPEPNTLENKFYPKTVFANLWTRTLQKDLEKKPAMRYNENFIPGMIDTDLV